MSQEKNAFAVELNKLIKISGVKYLTLSDAVGYDVSYISKWIGGKMLPSDKNVDEVIAKITHCLVSSLEEDKKKKIFCSFSAHSEEELRSAWADLLQQTYNECKSVQAKIKPPEFYLEKDIKEIYQKIANAVRDGASEISIMCDFSLLEHETLLMIAGIANGRFVDNEKRAGLTIHLYSEIDPNKTTEYDCLYLIHLMSGLCASKVLLHNVKTASQLVCVVKDNLLLTGNIFLTGGKATALTVLENSAEATKLYNKLSVLSSNKDLAFDRLDMDIFASGGLYLKSMVSEKIMWLIGHMTEHMVPDVLFKTLLYNLPETIREEAEKIYLFAQNIVKQNGANVLMYETAISDFIATGEIDFFNQKMQLNKAQRRECLEYLRQMAMHAINIRLIEGGFFSDFEHVYNPYLFISDRVTYLRLENCYDGEDILVCNDAAVKASLHKLYRRIWDNRKDVVVISQEIIIQKINHYIDLNELM